MDSRDKRRCCLLVEMKKLASDNSDNYLLGCCPLIARNFQLHILCNRFNLCGRIKLRPVEHLQIIIYQFFALLFSTRHHALLFSTIFTCYRLPYLGHDSRTRDIRMNWTTGCWVAAPNCQFLTIFINLTKLSNIGTNKTTPCLFSQNEYGICGTDVYSESFTCRNVLMMVKTSLDEATDPWGVRVERVEVKDVRLPVQLQRAMAAEAEAAREARAKVIAAEGEQKASRALKEAADVMAESPAAIQLRYLQTLNTISAEKNSTIIFPLPIDLMQSFMRYTGGAKETTQAHF
ncbi:Hypothetical predicted protein [Mytilus galloprovincialis]|uniref:Band 7 domain-containing protein n=1 Tax=Mytilus galloprovincialis TaxID=29158 RepID=A0A8B6BQ75_MYTGA|nr:Hypothetical predicted protein [Mytilus galloprovincialis]